MPRVPTVEREQQLAADALAREAAERAKNSPEGMRETARGLRQRASQVPDGCDRDAMLRLAAEYERRATHRGRPL